MRLVSPRSSALVAALAVVVSAPTAFGSGAPAAPVVGVDRQCFAPTGHIDPQVNAAGMPTNPAWIKRDAVNQYCATLRLRDQFDSPAYGNSNALTGDQLYLAQAQEQAGDLPGGHVHGGVTTLIPGSQAADPFRAVDRWQRLTGGRAIPVKFTSSDGAQLRGHVFLPPTSARMPKGGYPGVVITDGSIQAYENLYYWAAEGLAQYGYEVMTYDVQGQGDSDLFPANCTPTSCPGVPYQQNYNFYQGAEDSLGWFDSKRNPGYTKLNRHRLGIAGHSLGAAAVSWVSQCDKRVKAVVAWDDLAPISMKQCAANVTVPKADRATTLHTPALALTNDYEFNVQPALTVPNPHGGTNGGGGDGDSGYRSLAKAGVDSQIVSIRNGTHLTYSYIPYVLPANELGERFAFYYTLAWFDEYLRGGHDPYTSQPAYSRLTNLGAYDASADRNRLGTVAIGAGTFDPSAAAANPTDTTAGNVPYRIKGIHIPDSLSFYYYSEYRLTNAHHRVHTCSDMRARCPRVQPRTP
jgi:dienelactone hydrolase